MNINEQNFSVGDESVVIGNVRKNVGNKSVVIGATNNRCNTILNKSMAVGYGAKAGPDSIAIGAYAGSGIEPKNVTINNVNGVQVNDPEINFKTSLI